MSFISTTYFLFWSCAVVLYWAVIPRKWRCLFLAVTSFVFASTFSPLHAVLFLAMSGVAWAAGLFFASPGSPLKKRLIFIALFLALGGSLLMYKLFYSGSGRGDYNPSHTALVFGFSYFTFRLIHYLIECFRRGAPAHSLLDVVCYLFFFPTFLSGPVERFPAFNAQKDRGSLESADINYGLYRVMRGIIKKIFLADVLSPVIMPVFRDPAGVNRGLILVSVYALAIQIFMDFSGYTDIAIGSARLFGYRIMENFDRPFFKTNIAQFWRSWHISVYTWIRDYFFFPVFGYRASKYTLYAGLLCAMLVFHLWHGISSRFFLLGIYHGFLLAGWQAFREIKPKVPFLRRLNGSFPQDIASAFLTFNAVSFGFLLFVCDIPHVQHVIKRLAGFG